MEFCRAAIIPRADAQIMAVIWLENYIYVYGDDSPTFEEVHLATQYKRTVYQEYIKHFSVVCSPPRPTVSYRKFVELWNGLYPEVLSRPYSDVVGKCNLCFKIHEIRTTSKNSAAQLKAKEAHQLHRGGMFMRERYE
jgi:hypothetical protein